MEIDGWIFDRATFKRGVWTFIPKRSEGGIMVSAIAGEAGPTVAQREFFQSVWSRLPEFEQRARACIDSQFPPPMDAVGLSAYAIVIGDEDDVRRREFVLEMTDHNAHIIHRVSFSGEEPVNYGFDC